MILDATCGARRIWYNKTDAKTIYLDKRNIKKKLLTQQQNRNSWGRHYIEVRPTIQADNTALPFPDNVFDMVVYDPPFLIEKDNPNFCLNEQYGYLLPSKWVKEIYTASRECFRVLKVDGFLQFKWNECYKSVKQVLSLFPCKPLFGTNIKSHKKNKTWWVVFRKLEE